jgi:hypothetical protein
MTRASVFPTAMKSYDGRSPEYQYRKRILAKNDTYLGHDHDLVSGQVMLLDRLAQDDFGESIRVHLPDRSPTIQLDDRITERHKRARKTYISRIERVDPSIVRSLDMFDALLLPKEPVSPFFASVAHASEYDARDFESGLAETD